MRAFHVGCGKVITLPSMHDDEKKDDGEGSIYRVDTVPPPPGEDDAYSAPTRVGEMPPEVLEAMRAAGLGMDKKSAPKVTAALPRPAAVPHFDASEKAKTSDPAPAAPAPSAPALVASAPAPAAIAPAVAASAAPAPVARVDDEAPLASLLRDDEEAAQELGDSSIEVVRSFARDDDGDDDPTRMHPSAGPLPPALGPGSMPGLKPVMQREALLVLALVVALIVLAMAVGAK